MTYLRTSFGNICQDMAGAEGFEPSARGFGGAYPHCLELTYLRRFPLCCLEKYDGNTTLFYYLKISPNMFMNY